MFTVDEDARAILKNREDQLGALNAAYKSACEDYFNNDTKAARKAAWRVIKAITERVGWDVGNPPDEGIRDFGERLQAAVVIQFDAHRVSGG